MNRRGLTVAEGLLILLWLHGIGIPIAKSASFGITLLSIVFPPFAWLTSVMTIADHFDLLG